MQNILEEHAYFLLFLSFFFVALICFCIDLDRGPFHVHARQGWTLETGGKQGVGQGMAEGNDGGGMLVLYKSARGEGWRVTNTQQVWLFWVRSALNVDGSILGWKGCVKWMRCLRPYYTTRHMNAEQKNMRRLLCILSFIYMTTLNIISISVLTQSTFSKTSIQTFHRRSRV
jgi:hypothetical protein